MKPNQLFPLALKKGAMIILLIVVGFLPLLQSQETFAIRGSIGKSAQAADSSSVFIYGMSNGMLDQVIFENINICISIPDQGDNNPTVNITQNFIPSLDWTYAGMNYPDIIDGRAYYTFIGNDNESGTKISWPANTEMPVIELKFTGGTEKVKIQLNDLTSADGIGSGGGPSLQSFWYVQLNEAGDRTDYEAKYFQSSGSLDPDNGGNSGSSYVESVDEISLPVLDVTSSGWELFPNPTQGSLHLVSGVTGKAQFFFYDGSGKLLEMEKRNVIKGQATTFDCTPYPAGMLFVQVRSEDGALLYKRGFLLNRD